MLGLLCNYDRNQPYCSLMLWNCVISGCALQGKMGDFYALSGSFWTFSSGLRFMSKGVGQ